MTHEQLFQTMMTNFMDDVFNRLVQPIITECVGWLAGIGLNTVLTVNGTWDFLNQVRLDTSPEFQLASTRPTSDEGSVAWVIDQLK